MTPTTWILDSQVCWDDGDQHFEGVVVAFVKAGELPSFRRFPQLFKSVCEHGPRLQESCVVVANGVAHWPEADRLTLSSKQRGSAEPSLRNAGAKTNPAKGVVARPALPPASGSRTKMLLSADPSFHCALYPFWPHTTAPYGPIFVGHFDAEAITAHVIPEDRHGPVRLAFVSDADGESIAQGYLRISKKRAIGVEVLFRQGRRVLLTTTQAAAAMLPRALGIDHAGNRPKPFESP